MYDLTETKMKNFLSRLEQFEERNGDLFSLLARIRSLNDKELNEIASEFERIDGELAKRPVKDSNNLSDL